MLLGELFHETFSFVISPLGQLLFWGCMTIWTFCNVMLQGFSDRIDNYAYAWRIVIAFIMLLVWLMNASMYVLASYIQGTIKSMIIIDVLLLAIVLAAAHDMRQRWSYILGALYAIILALDILYIRGMDYSWYAAISGIVYGVQLLIVMFYPDKRRVVDV